MRQKPFSGWAVPVPTASHWSLQHSPGFLVGCKGKEKEMVDKRSSGTKWETERGGEIDTCIYLVPSNFTTVVAPMLAIITCFFTTETQDLKTKTRTLHLKKQKLIIVVLWNITTTVNRSFLNEYGVTSRNARKTAYLCRPTLKFAVATLSRPSWESKTKILNAKTNSKTPAFRSHDQDWKLSLNTSGNQDSSRKQQPWSLVLPNKAVDALVSAGVCCSADGSTMTKQTSRSTDNRLHDRQCWSTDRTNSCKLDQNFSSTLYARGFWVHASLSENGTSISVIVRLAAVPADIGVVSGWAWGLSPSPKTKSEKSCFEQRTRGPDFP